MKTGDLWKLRAEFLKEVREETEQEEIDTITKMVISTTTDLFIRWVEEKLGK
jgi:hypothetical protein